MSTQEWAAKTLIENNAKWRAFQATMAAKSES